MNPSPLVELVRELDRRGVTVCVSPHDPARLSCRPARGCADLLPTLREQKEPLLALLRSVEFVRRHLAPGPLRCCHLAEAAEAEGMTDPDYSLALWYVGAVEGKDAQGRPTYALPP